MGYKLGNQTGKKISIACDHRGFELKKELTGWLQQKGYEVVDCGCFGTESCDYPEFIMEAAQKVGTGECTRAIGICYTGNGSVIAANKVRGVRAALVHQTEEASLCRAHNDANMLILASGFTERNLFEPIIEKFLSTGFEGGRHARRVQMITDFENQQR